MTIHLMRDLEALHQHILAMSAMAQELIRSALSVLTDPHADRARALIEQDKEVDLWDVRIEDECLKILALHQPVASDLRRIAATLKVTGELERVADLGSNIAERACGLAAGPALPIPEKLQRMARMSLDMLDRSIESYVRLDSQMARAVCQEDDAVDALNREIIDELIAVMKSSPDLVDPGMHLFSASRYVERIADHATNIAEDVVYLVEGEIIRHAHKLGSSGPGGSSDGGNSRREQ